MQLPRFVLPPVTAPSVRTLRHIGALLLSGFGLCVIGYYLIAPPITFAPVSAFRIAPGTNVPAIATQLAEAHVIAHPDVLRAVLHMTGQSMSVQAGVYRFETPQNALQIAYRLVTGDLGFPPVRMTFIEGITTREIASQLASSTLDIAPETFRTAAEPYEGYLFPDTYFFPSSADTYSIISTMRQDFNVRIAGLLPEVQASGHSLSDIVTMASIVEKEARTTAARKMIAGILWNRIARDMPLQVDAVFGYIFDRPTYSPSLEDLKVDSPYNTYTHIGLPPGPICNPGLDAITATLEPTKTKYLYYSTDKNGVMHYATTYAGHQANLRRYPVR